MSKELKISFLERSKRPVTSNKSDNILRAILPILLIPFYFLFALLLLVAGWVFPLWRIVSIVWQKLKKKEIIEPEIQSEQWGIFTSSDSVTIEHKFAGSLPWNSGDYLYLDSEPPIPYLSDKIFGDWLFADFGGVFLQKWNSIQNINCDLVFIDFNTLNVVEVKTAIPTKHWATEKINSSEIKFTFSTATDDLVYIVKQQEIITDNYII